MRNTIRFILFALSFLIVVDEAFPASQGESIRRKIFYTNKDFGELGWLHRARGREDANLQVWITYFPSDKEICLPSSNQTYWIQINHRNKKRAGKPDAFLVAILYHRPSSIDFDTEADLQLYRNENWYFWGVGRKEASILGKFDKDPPELAKLLGAPTFIELNSGSSSGSDDRFRTLKTKIGDFHARVAADANALSSWQGRSLLSESASALIDKTVFRYAARLYRFKTTNKINSNNPVIIELNRHGAKNINLILQSLSREVREGLRMTRIKFQKDCD